MKTKGDRVLLFDGYCNLCNGVVQFIIKNDPKGRIGFAPLQSGWAKSNVPDGLDQPGNFDSVLYLRDGKLYSKSEAVFLVVGDLGGWLKVLLIGKVLPTKWLNQLYDWVARNRYGVFGKQANCMVPTPEVRDRFLDW